MKYILILMLIMFTNCTCNENVKGGKLDVIEYLKVHKPTHIIIHVNPYGQYSKTIDENNNIWTFEHSIAGEAKITNQKKILNIDEERKNKTKSNSEKDDVIKKLEDRIKKLEETSNEMDY